MTTVTDLIDLARKKIEENKAQASAVGTVYKFVLDGEGGGTFVLHLTENPHVLEGDHPAECTINVAASDLVDMIEGRADSRQLFFAGRLRVDGDIGLAMKLKKLSEASIRLKT